MDLMELGPYLGDRYDIVSVQGPNPYGPGYSWFDIDFSIEDTTSVHANCVQAHESLANLRETLSGLGGPIVLLGFSQGAMMAIGFWLEHGALVDGVVSMSGGWLPCFKAAQPSSAPIFLSHGTMDPIVPIEFGRSSAERLRQISQAVSVLEYPGGHELTLECVETVSRWLAEIVPTPHSMHD
jgi:phospholipase/carboxylesterase